MPSFRLRRLTSAPWVQTALGVLAAEYIRLVWHTTRFHLEPADIYESAKPELPVIVTTWHGHHYLLPCLKREGHRAKTLISHHRDGAMNATAAKRLGINVIRGSGTHSADFHKKGGVSAFREMLTALEQGYNIALTADVPKVARVCGLGIVKLASMSGRAIYPAAIANSHRIEFNNWDRSAVPFPFGRGAMLAGTPVRVPRDADATQLEEARLAVETSLNAAYARAYAIADRTQEGAARG